MNTGQPRLKLKNRFSLVWRIGFLFIRDRLRQGAMCWTGSRSLVTYAAVFRVSQ